MSLSSTSNTINALGIFGRLDPKQESYFRGIQNKFSRFPESDESVGIFNHLSLLINRNVPIGHIAPYIDILHELKPYVPFKLQVKGVIVRDGKHIALSFDIQETEKIRRIASKFVPDGIVNTFYTKVVRFVPEENQQEVIKMLRDTNKMIFCDFLLCANRQDDASIIYSTNKYK